MNSLVRQYLEGEISRRSFISGLCAVGITSVAANSMASSLTPFVAQSAQSGAADQSSQSSWLRQMRGTGGALMVAQLRAAGVSYIFFNPSTGDAPIYDALVDEPEIQPILGLQEGACAAIAGGYAKASGKTPVVVIAPQGMPNCMAQMDNAHADNVPMVVVSSSAGELARPFTKGVFDARTAQSIPDVTRRAFKLATTHPRGPVCIDVGGALSQQAEAAVMDQTKFDVPMTIRPDQAVVEKVARLLLEAKSPLLYVGDEIVAFRAEKEVLELAELLTLPVARPLMSAGWSKPFPTRHPLYVGDYLGDQRYPENVDVILNLGSRHLRGLQSTLTPEMDKRARLIQVRINPEEVNATYPSEMFLLADLKLAVADLLTALKSMAMPARLRQIRDSRFSKTQEHTAKMRAYRQSIARSRWNESTISLMRLGAEMESVLEKDTCVVADPERGRGPLHNMMEYGGEDKLWMSNGRPGATLGWAASAAFGVKLALPDRPVVAVIGDGGFLFGGPTALWSMARYHCGATVIIVNNKSYDRERSSMLGDGGRMFETGRDMACYFGDPDINFAKMAEALGVEGEVVPDVSALRPALERSKRANAAGRPYLLDVHVAREGFGARSTWYPPYSIQALRRR